MATAPVAAAVSDGGLIEIELSGRRRVHVDASVDVSALNAVTLEPFIGDRRWEQG
jgi:hypothetical protein